MSTRLEAIFFDLDDTLFSTSTFAARARRAACEAMTKVGLDMPVEELLAELDEVVAEFSSNYDHHFDQLLRRIPRRHYKSVNTGIIVAAGIIAYHETKARELAPYPDADELLVALRETDLIRGVITSGLTAKQAEKILRLGIYDHFSPKALFISDQIGINKPNVKLYKRACSDLNLKPSHCMYIGDRADRDIDPPNSIGMITVHMVRDGKYAGVKGQTEPTHRVSSFRKLADILHAEYGIPLSLPGDAEDAISRR